MPAGIGGAGEALHPQNWQTMGQRGAALAHVLHSSEAFRGRKTAVQTGPAFLAVAE